MADAIIHFRGPQVQIISGLMPDLSSEGGWDYASMDVCFRGTHTQLASAFPRGGNLFGQMYCMGPSGAQEKFGHIWAKITYKGFWSAPPENLISWNYSTRETTFPQEVGGQWVIFGIPSGKAGQINPATGRPWRVKLTETIGAVTMQGWSITDANAPPALPAVPVSGKPPGQTTINWTGVNDPELNENVAGVGGYVLTQYAEIAKQVVGTKSFREWQAMWEWQDKQGPGDA